MKNVFLRSEAKHDKYANEYWYPLVATTLLKVLVSSILNSYALFMEGIHTTQASMGLLKEILKEI